MQLTACIVVSISAQDVGYLLPLFASVQFLSMAKVPQS